MVERTQSDRSADQGNGSGGEALPHPVGTSDRPKSSHHWRQRVPSGQGIYKGGVGVVRTFGVYQLDESLAETPFGELVAARHPARSEPLAVLLLDARLSGDHRFRGLVRLELARVGGLRQPGIARMVEVSEQSGALAVVYERPAESVSLADWQASHDQLGQPGPDAALGLVRRVAEALDAAHGRRIVHGLLSPSAVLVGQDQAPAIIGVGLLAAVEEAGQREAILEGADREYLAPEQQIASGDTRRKAAVASADGYALGALAERVLGSHAGPARPILARQQSPDPAQRFGSGAVFAAALAEQISPPSVSAGPAGSPTYTTPSWATPPTTPRPEMTPTPAPQPPAPAPPVSPPPISTTPTPPPWAVPPTTQPLTVAPEPPTPAPEQPSAESEAAPAPSAPALPDTPAWGVPPAPAAPPFETPSYAAPPPSHVVPPPTDASPPPPTAPLPGHTAAKAPSNLPGWLQDSLDPPAARTRPLSAPGPSAPASFIPTPIQRSSSGPASPPNITRLPPTSNMLACKQEAERTDILTTGVLAITSRVEMLDEWVDRYAPEGRIGPVPLGAAVAGVLCLLLLLLRQPAGAAIFVVIALGVYVFPPVLRKITASEQPRLEAIRATGPVSIRVREIAPRWDTYEMEIGDGAPLTITPSGYRRLRTLGQPVVVERQGPHGPEQHTVAHDLPTMTVTYLMPGRLLLDVRDAAGTVFHRHPEYAGEPGDQTALATPDGAEEARTGRRPFAEQPDAVPTWRQTARGHRMVQRMPPQLTDELRAAFKSAATKAGFAVGIPAAILLVSMITGDFGFFAVFFAIAIFGFVGVGLTVRAINLQRAQQADAIVRVAAQVETRLVERSGAKKKTQHHYLLLDDGKELTITTHTSGNIRFEIEGGNIGWQHLDLFEAEGVDPSRVIVGHTDENADLRFLEALCRRGAYVQFDVIGKGHWMLDETRAELAARLIDRGFGRQLLLGSDRARKTELLRYGGLGYRHLLLTFVPMLRAAGLDDAAIRMLLVENPAHALQVR